MPDWNVEYKQKLVTRFDELARSLRAPLSDVTLGRVVPSLDDIAIGSARNLSAAALFFDIRGFTLRTSSPEHEDLKRTLIMLDYVVPTVMQIVFDHGGYVEKNTGDGIMALMGIGEERAVAANRAIDVAVTTFHTLKHIVNPALTRANIQPVDARIGIDLGNLLIARIGTPTGSSAHPRNFLTAVGPAANIASKLQGKAGTNEIWVGNSVKQLAHDWRQSLFIRKDALDQDWPWIIQGTTERYAYWHYSAVRS
jgi:adenylate cyclase